MVLQARSIWIARRSRRRLLHLAALDFPLLRDPFAKAAIEKAGGSVKILAPAKDEAAQKAAAKKPNRKAS